MKLCIADPPYLPNVDGHPRASRWYGNGMSGRKSFHERDSPLQARGDYHEASTDWDDPATHRQMMQRLADEYDGWAVAMAPDSLYTYLQWVQPAETRIAVWHRPNAVPGGSALIASWEPVLVKIPQGRRSHTSRAAVRDVLRCNISQSFVGEKPPAWTRWVLDMLGYDPDTDTVDDLFHGSGAVAAEIAQQVLHL